MTSLSGLKMMDMVLLWMILSPAMETVEVRRQWEVDWEEEVTTGDQDKILCRTGQIENPWTDQHLLLLVLIASGWLNNIIMISLESMSHNSIMSGECLQQPGNWPAPITTIRYYNQAAERNEGMFSVRVWPSMIDSSGQHSTLLQQIWASSANDADCSRSLSNTSHTWTYFSCPHSVTPVSSLLLSLVSVISWSFLLLHWWPQTSVPARLISQSRATSRRSAVRESAASPASSSWFTPDINISTDTRPLT